jgi:hypothetical protein
MGKYLPIYDAWIGPGDVRRWTGNRSGRHPEGVRLNFLKVY